MYEIACTDVKSVYWNTSFTHAAIVTKTCKQTNSLTPYRTNPCEQELRSN